MYQLTRLEYLEVDYMYNGETETLIIGLYIDCRTQLKYILNKIKWTDYAYVSLYNYDTLNEKEMIILNNEKVAKKYGPNPLSLQSWKINSHPYSDNHLDETDIIKT